MSAHALAVSSCPAAFAHDPSLGVSAHILAHGTPRIVRPLRSAHSPQEVDLANKAANKDAKKPAAAPAADKAKAAPKAAPKKK